jgi:hypothetical protein
MITPDQNMWMTGGFYGLNSSILISNDGSSGSGPNLPHGLSNHAIVSINETLSLLIGGEDKELIVMDTTYYFSHETEKWTEGPHLNQPRMAHTAGLITDKVTKETFLIVVGGRKTHQYDSELNTTEIMMNGAWVSGENLHFSIYLLIQYL